MDRQTTREVLATLIKAKRRDLAQILASIVYTDPNVTPQQLKKLAPMRDLIIRQAKRHAGTIMALHIKLHTDGWFAGEAELSAKVQFTVPDVDSATTPKSERFKIYHVLANCTKRGACTGYLDRFSGKDGKRRYKYRDMMGLLQHWPDI